MTIAFRCERCFAEGEFAFGADATQECLFDVALIAKEEADVVGDPYCNHELWFRLEVAA